MQLFLETASEMANSADPDQTAPSSHFVRNFGLKNFRTFTIIQMAMTRQAQADMGLLVAKSSVLA